MTSSVVLREGHLRCELAPAIGGAIAGLWFDDVAVLRSVAATELASPRRGGSFCLLPYSNRIGCGQLQWDGVDYQLRTTPGDEPHAIHGVGWQHAWSVIESDDHSAALHCVHQSNDAWPFAFEATQRLRLGKDTLSMRLNVVNTAAVPAPVGLGWHPYFVKRRSSHIHFAAREIWAVGADKLPTTREPSTGLDVNCTALRVDNLFDGWSGTAELHDELFHVQLRSNLDRLVVYTNAQQSFVAIEPVSHVSNAVQLSGQAHIRLADLGMRVLAPGEVFSAEMSIRISRVT